ncbi:hypothetical protein Elgi_36700 [Paenibacillus elgii]|uniref:YonK family protein n=1 Tax=Paenibacillus elgii TaxID=189691 RepID=UPI002D7D8916|nr:hypothetical protein Elgi_36700 [Paenibacillus elgii]
MAELTKSYAAKGVLSTLDSTLTEVTKKGTFTHDFGAALREFEGHDITISITLKEKVTPIDSESAGD